MSPLLSAMSLTDVLRTDLLEVLASFGLLMVATVAVGLVLRHRLRHLHSLRAMVLVLALASLVLALAAALLSARLMLLDGAQVRQFVVVLGAAAGFGAVLVAIAARPLAEDVRRLGSASGALERGDLGARSGVDRRDELGHAARAFDAMAARLALLEDERQRDEEERRLLLTSVSHDLRTPVTALALAIESLADGVAPDPNRYVQSMRSDVAALSSLIDDLFLLLRIERGQAVLVAERIDLAEVADDAVTALLPLAHDLGVLLELEVDDRPQVLADAGSLGRVVRNLVDNALRHSPAGGRVAVTLEDADAARLHVHDTGPGFPPGFGERAFEPFARADDARSRADGGAGLGLAIARGLVVAHGGSVAIGPGPGGHVVVTLPTAPAVVAAVTAD